MDQLRIILARIGKQLTLLSVTQKLLIASLCILMLMSLFLVSQYAGSARTVALIPGGTAEDQQKASAFLEGRGFKHTINTDGKVLVAADTQYVALAAMAKEQQLPGDKRLMFEGLIAQQNPFMGRDQIKQQRDIAHQNELANIIRNFPGIESASVMVSAPEPSGINTSFKKPVAQVAVFPRRGMVLDQGTVNALADLVASSVAGLDVRDVAIVDGTNSRSYRAQSRDDFFATDYLQQVAKVEERVQDKLESHLRFMSGVIVSVNAIVDGAKRETTSKSYMNKGDGSVSLPTHEESSNNTSSNTTKAAEAGMGSNLPMDINRGGGSGTQSSQESSTVKSDVKIGERNTHQQDARGKPTKINVTVSVPREYVMQVVKQRKGAAGGDAAAQGAEPTEDEIKAEWESATGVKSKLEEMIAPLIETEAPGAVPGMPGGQLAAGTVKAFLIPVAMSTSPVNAGSGFGGMLGSGGSGGIAGMLDTPIVKPVLVGALALASLGMMFVMIRKAGKQATLPTAEELVGIPPALEPGSDVVGEADETDTAMTGIEIDDDALKANKMLEEVVTLVKNNPSQASTVFNRWVNTER